MELTVLDDLIDERLRQAAKWGEQNIPDGTARVDDFDMAVSARNECETAMSEGRVTWRHVLEEEVREAFCESDVVRLRAELVQVAAVAWQWIEAIDRRD